jgi:Predicted transcriptional regulator with C-terminal CBS domains
MKSSNSLNSIGLYLKTKRNEVGLTQAEFALRSGVGLSFVRALEQGKKNLSMAKVEQALSFFNAELVAKPKS